MEEAGKVGTQEKMEPIHISAAIVAGNNRQIIASTRGHKILMDVRKERGGDDVAPTPPEYLAIALGGCIFNICRLLLMEKQMELRDLRVSITGDVDPSRAFGLCTENRAGFSQLSADVELASQLSESEKEAFRQELLVRCPLCDTMSNPTPLQVRVA